MDPNDYVMAWVAYLTAALVLSVLAWRLFRRFLPPLLAWLLECWLLALLLTPWYVLEDQKILAPAFIVFALDTITVEPLAGIRALTPLVLALLGATLLAVVLSVAERVWRRTRVSTTSAAGADATVAQQYAAFMLDTAGEPAADAEPEASIGPLAAPTASPVLLSEHSQEIGAESGPEAGMNAEPGPVPGSAGAKAATPAKTRAPRKRKQTGGLPEPDTENAAPVSAAPRRRRKANPEPEQE